VEVYEYMDESGYGFKNRLFYCENSKHEECTIIRQVYIESMHEWLEEHMAFDTDSFKFLKAIINGNKDEIGGKYTLIRNYNDEINNNYTTTGVHLH